MEQMKKHYFFYGVDWESIRQIDAPFVPHLRSVTDTSYFPTDEIDQGADNGPANPEAAGKDLAFLGYAPLLIRSFFTANPSTPDILSRDLLSLRYLRNV